MARMTVAELISQLEDFDGDTEVRLAQQPNWPFEYSISEIVEVAVGDTDEDDEDATDEPEGERVVYIGEGSQLGYLSGNASRELGWR